MPVSDVICQIVSGELDAAVVARNDQVIAFLDHRPVFKGHVLVAPIRHIETLLSLPDELMVPLMTMTQRIAGAIGSALGAQGTFVAINNVVSQSIPHLHVHVVPRTKDSLRRRRDRGVCGQDQERDRRLNQSVMAKSVKSNRSGLPFVSTISTP